MSDEHHDEMRDSTPAERRNSSQKMTYPLDRAGSESGLLSWRGKESSDVMSVRCCLRARPGFEQLPKLARFFDVTRRAERANVMHVALASPKSHCKDVIGLPEVPSSGVLQHFPVRGKR
mmetsp:Transcript_4601/g.8677  ORF Transcript_4601/g.8677 Transcript_4601/m.8677 type:complete len:119 (+) Transcript_4601:162-518(+)